MKTNYFADLFLTPPPLFKSELRAIDSPVQAVEPASNDNSLISVLKHEKSTVKVRVYQICLGNKIITAIDTSGVTYDQFIKRINTRFGVNRVKNIKPLLFKK